MMLCVPLPVMMPVVLRSVLRGWIARRIRRGRLLRYRYDRQKQCSRHYRYKLLHWNLLGKPPQDDSITL